MQHGHEIFQEVGVSVRILVTTSNKACCPRNFDHDPTCVLLVKFRGRFQKSDIDPFRFHEDCLIDQHIVGSTHSMGTVAANIEHICSTSWIEMEHLEEFQ